METNIQLALPSKQLQLPASTLQVPVAEVRGPPRSHLQSQNQVQKPTTTVNVPSLVSIPSSDPPMENESNFKSSSSVALLSNTSISIVEKSSISSNINPVPAFSSTPSSPKQVTTNPSASIVIPPTAKELCDVCCEYKPRSLLRGCSDCKHRYCASCVDKYWTGAIYSGNHARLLCMYGGCGIRATDNDVASVVSQRAFRKMLFFRSRDAYGHIPGARWCAADMCWEYLGAVGPGSGSNSSASGSINGNPSITRSDSGKNRLAAAKRRLTLGTSTVTGNGNISSPHITACHRCHSKTCVKCEREVPPSVTVHICAARKANKAHTALFGMWALLHTKACPACAARIQRNHGCSHMTCTRCSSYFCWRCKGFLNNGCPLPGRACICDRVMTAAAYSGLAVAGVVGSPLIIGAAVVAGPPYLVYRAAKLHRSKSHRGGDPGMHRSLDAGTSSARINSASLNALPSPYNYARTIPRGFAHDEYNDDRFDHATARSPRFSGVFIDDTRISNSTGAGRLSRSRGNLRSTPADVPRLVLSSSSSFPSNSNVVQSSEGIEKSTQQDQGSTAINPDSVIVDELDYDERIDSGSVRFRSFRDIIVTESRRGDSSSETVIKRARSPRKNSRLDLARVTSAGTASSTNSTPGFKHFHSRSGQSLGGDDAVKFHMNDDIDEMLDRQTTELPNVDRRNEHSIIIVEGRGIPYKRGVSNLSTSDDDIPGVNVGICPTSKSFTLERRRVSVVSGRSVRRSVV